MDAKNSKQFKEIQRAIGFCRGHILDSCELEIGGQPNWRFFRSRILKLLGESGLEGNIAEILNASGLDWDGGINERV